MIGAASKLTLLASLELEPPQPTKTLLAVRANREAKRNRPLRCINFLLNCVWLKLNANTKSGVKGFVGDIALVGFLSHFTFKNDTRLKLEISPAGNDLSVVTKDVALANINGRHRVKAIKTGKQIKATIGACFTTCQDRKSTRLNSSHVRTSYAVFCLK